jgi:gliding motility-associated-like protein
VSAVDQADVTVYSLFAGDIDLLVKTPICQGTSTTLQAISNGNNTGPLTYTWNQGLGNNSGPINVVPNVPTVYSVTVSTSCGTSVVVRDTVDFIDPPVVNFTGDTAQGCYPLLVVFNDSSLQNPADSIVSWFWNFGDGTTSTQQNPTYIYQDVGTYNVTLNIITKEGCNVTTAASAYQVKVYDRPTAGFNASPQPVYIPLGEVSFENTSVNATTYTWDFGDGIISTVKDPKYEYGNVGNYEAMLIAIDSKGCRDTAYKTILVSGDFIMPNAFTPNPNGSSGGLFNPAALDNDIFAAYVKGAKEYKMHIFNRWGELIFESTDPSIGWDGYYREEICQAGVYIWQVYILFNDGRELKRVGDLNLIR